uniref:Uncharacterized mitochondrial protein ymf27 n=1 Tax=Marchantia polymorpha TaxID=3197 RepID=YMF27_MARPO|nr:hypothetical protein MapooMp13 [Marchantia paleacea]P38469.1 RecName: Full=Uncharacterized mitochondrial protein ymf27; AltName: Full=ORF69 [Marchantia polymorpha]AAC09407.1 ORF69 [Marchantia paleacea]
MASLFSTFRTQTFLYPAHTFIYPAHTFSHFGPAFFGQALHLFGPGLGLFERENAHCHIFDNRKTPPRLQ